MNVVYLKSRVHPNMPRNKDSAWLLQKVHSAVLLFNLLINKSLFITIAYFQQKSLSGPLNFVSVHMV